MSKRLSTLRISVCSVSILLGLCGINILNSNNIDTIKTLNAETVDASVTSVKDAITKLANSKNYTIKVTTKTGPLDIVNNMYYTENAFYDDYLGDEIGYIKCDDGVYKFDRYARQFTPSGLLKDSKGEKVTSLWGSGYFYGFNDLDLSEFDSATGKKFDCSKKKNKLTFMKMFSIDQTKYPDVNVINLEVNDSVNTLTFKVSLKNGEQHSCEIKNFNTTTIDYLAKQDSVDYYKPDATMQKIIDLFSGLNYTQYIFDESYSKTEYAGYAKFCENYFYSAYTPEYIKTNSSALLTTSGMVGLDNYYVNDQLTMNGSYYAFLYEDTIQYVTTFPYNKDPYVPNVYTYPTFLEGLKNSQYFASAGVEGKYYTNKLSVISDFCSNFQLWDSLSENNFTPCGLFVTYDKSFNNEDTVTFSIEYDYFGYKGTTDYIFSSFGSTREQVLETQYVKKYMNCYYNGNKVTVNVEGKEEKPLTIRTKKDWLLDDNIVEAYQYEHYSNAEAGSIITFSVAEHNGNNKTSLTITPDDSTDNDNYVEDNGVYKIKETANTSIYVFKLKDGSWKFRAVKVK